MNEVKCPKCGNKTASGFGRVEPVFRLVGWDKKDNRIDRDITKTTWHYSCEKCKQEFKIEEIDFLKRKWRIRK